ncbi:MAG: hypothetical protein GY717_04090 [Rhodobacteraceae bacterium]|nr:hypothetical protein [Paracoccaceae bacterium]
MSLVLDRPVRVGAVTLAALCRVRVVPHGWRGGAAVVASKDPVALLIGSGGQVSGFAPDGRALGPEALEALCPGAVAAFASFTGEAAGG